MSVDHPREASSAPIEILHIDDDSSFLDLTSTFLGSELPEANITTAVGAEAGLAELEESQVHCVVSDYEMPGQDGLALLETIRQRYPDLPFILYTGKGSEEIAAKAINAGVTGYLQKGGPDQHRRLANRIEHAATEYRAQIESERYSTVLKALGYPIYVVSENATFEYVNDAFVELTGYDREEIIGSETSLIKDEAGVERANNILASIVSSTGPDTKQFRVDIHRKDGTVVPCYDHMAALPFDEEFRGSVGILRDISREQQRREELARQNERLEEFVSVVSHDLRAPIDKAKTAAELAETTGEEEFFEQLAAEHERMETMIEELLELAREGESVTETEPVAIGPLAEESWEPFGDDDDTLEITVASEFTVSGNPARIQRLFENLLRNAVDHCSSPVRVTVGELGETEGFYVADDGPGIKPDRRQEVFKPGRTSDDDGTGFGLTIVKRIAAAHGWRIAVTDSDDGGARFEFVTDDCPAKASNVSPFVEPTT